MFGQNVQFADTSDKIFGQNVQTKYKFDKKKVFMKYLQIKASNSSVIHGQAALHLPECLQGLHSSILENWLNCNRNWLRIIGEMQTSIESYK